MRLVEEQGGSDAVKSFGLAVGGKFFPQFVQQPWVQPEQVPDSVSVLVAVEPPQQVPTTRDPGLALGPLQLAAHPLHNRK